MYNGEALSFLSADGVHNIHAEIYTPEAEPSAVIQIAHGMCDHIGRYKVLIEALLASGFAVCGSDHLGHGLSASAEERGYFAEKDGRHLVIEDLYSMNKIARERFPGKPVVILGHSMGSFLARLFVAKYPDAADAAIIHGTGGPNPLLPIAKLLAKTLMLFRGKKHRSKFLAALTFVGYNSKFPKEEGSSAWLSRDLELVRSLADERVGFVFTVSAYLELYRMLGESNSKKWFSEYPKEKPTLIVSGDMDPVGDYGRGPTFVYKKLMLSGAKDVTLKLYPGARHELFNETNRDELFRDLAAWIKEKIG